MKSRQSLRFIFGVFLLYMSCVNAGYAAELYKLTHEQWFLPKKAETVLQMTAIRSTLAEFEKSPSSELLILYPGGDEGTLWANEVKAWLVSLGISSRQIELRPGSSDSNIIEMRVDSPIFDMIKNR